MQSILITLTTAGSNTDNFSLYTDLDGYTTPIETGVSKASLVAGYVSTIVPDGATVIRVQSVSSCTNYVDFPITGITTTTTSTTTSTTTIEPTTTTTSTTTSTTTPEPTTTSTTTSTTTVSCDCTYYNVVVTSEDIDNAIGNTNPAWNNTVWAYYYDCETGTSSDVIYSSADNYYHSLCNNNLFGTPYLYNHINDAVTVVVSSTITNSLDCCSAGTTTTTSTTTSTTTVEPTTTTSTTTSTTTIEPILVNFYLNFDASNSGVLDCYTASPISAGYTLSNTLTTNGSSFNVNLLPGDGFYATITHDTRASSGQRGQITTNDNAVQIEYVVTTIGTLPKSISSTPVGTVAGHTYDVYGLCGDQI